MNMPRRTKTPQETGRQVQTKGGEDVENMTLPGEASAKASASRIPDTPSSHPSQ